MPTFNHTAEEVDWSDVQGIVRRGFRYRPYSLFVILSICERAKAGKWLCEIAKTLPSGMAVVDQYGNSIDLGDPVLRTVAISRDGLVQLGLSETELSQFSEEFSAGMTPLPEHGRSVSRRSGMLGDEEESAPSNWLWGGWETENPEHNKSDGACQRARIPAKQVHIFLGLYGKRSEDNDLALKEVLEGDNGVCLSSDTVRGDAKPSVIPSYVRKDGKGHFGFRDGISQPLIKDTPELGKYSDKALQIHAVAPGEILLGYANERGLLQPCPMVAPPGGNGAPLNLGINGSYLVVRQLEQHVEAFDALLETYAEKLRPSFPVKDAKSWIADRLMGRTQEGLSIVDTEGSAVAPPHSPDHICDPQGNVREADEQSIVDEETARPINDFVYAEDDESGLDCPLTAHIRRGFPRDSLDPSPEVALKISRRHRILRRGRIYGKVPEHSQPDWLHTEMVDANIGRCEYGNYGLVFMAINADIAGQFETIQHTWINNRHFGGRYDESDPIAATCPGDVRNHTIQNRPYNLPMRDIAKMVTVIGGCYLFLPGIKALGHLGTLAQNR